MDSFEFAKEMIRYSELYSALEESKRKISEYVLEQKETMSVGNLKASYRSGRTTYDYETPGREAPKYYIDEFTKTETKTTTDWRQVCKCAKIEPLILSKTDPSVNIEVCVSQEKNGLE